MNDILSEIEAKVRATANVEGFMALGPFGERHGSWELVLWRGAEADSVDRFVSLAFTELPRVWEVEFRVGAEKAVRFARRSVLRLHAESDDLSTDHFEQQIQLGLRRAIEVAKEMTESHLTEVYLEASHAVGKASGHGAAGA